MSKKISIISVLVLIAGIGVAFALTGDSGAKIAAHDGCCGLHAEQLSAQAPATACCCKDCTCEGCPCKTDCTADKCACGDCTCDCCKAGAKKGCEAKPAGGCKKGGCKA